MNTIKTKTTTATSATMMQPQQKPTQEQQHKRKYGIMQSMIGASSTIPTRAATATLTKLTQAIGRNVLVFAHC